MYDSITEETNRLKMDLKDQLKTFKREISDDAKNERHKSSEIIEKKVLSLRKEIIAE